MSRIRAVLLWDLGRGLGNRLFRVAAAAALGGGTLLLLVAPGPEAVPVTALLALLFFGTLLSILIGWASGQRTRDLGPFLFAQPVSPGELLAGKLAGTGLWSLALLVLFLIPSIVFGGDPVTLVAVGALAAGVLLVFVLAGLVIGLAAGPVSGLLSVLLLWGASVVGWEAALAVFAGAGWLSGAPALFIAALLANPAGAFRVGALVGIDGVPFDVEGIDAWGWLFGQIELVAASIFLLWLIVLFRVGVVTLRRQEI